MNLSRAPGLFCKTRENALKALQKVVPATCELDYFIAVNAEGRFAPVVVKGVTNSEAYWHAMSAFQSGVATIIG